MRGLGTGVWLLALVTTMSTGCKLNRASGDIAFMGDSLTLGWSFPRANLGINGQTTAQMLERFPRQVKDKGFRKVVILGGTNDVLLGIDAAVTEKNLGTMVDLARDGGVEPVLAEIPPIYLNNRDYGSKIMAVNAAIVRLGSEKQVKVVDYFHALDGHASAYSDGIHMKRVGYLRMETALAEVENPY